MNQINVIIRVEDSEAPENALETKFEECEIQALLAQPSLKLIHPVIEQFLKVFDPKRK